MLTQELFVSILEMTYRFSELHAKGLEPWYEVTELGQYIINYYR